MVRKGLQFAQLATLIFVTSTLALAEHRVALLISNVDYKNSENAVEKTDLDALQKALNSRGFRCQIETNLAGEHAFRNTIEEFSSRTPTRSTALVYFNGRLSDDHALLGTDSRSKYGIDRALSSLGTKGGSRTNFVVIDAQRNVDFKGTIPVRSLLTFMDSESLQSALAAKGDLAKTLMSAKQTTARLPDGVEITGNGSRAVSPPEKFVQGTKAGQEWVNDMGIVFCWCPPGTYVAGSPEKESGRYPDETQKQVTIKDGFWLSKYELALSQRVAKRGPGRTIATDKLHPMTMINHDDAKHMTRRYTESERKAGRLPGDWQYSLPSEEQWEYAARAGTTTRFYFGDDSSELPKHANFADKTYYNTGDIYSNSAHRTLDDGIAKLALVGSYRPNPWGFHDMYGNVAEWCLNRAIRGGGWPSVADNCRSAYRDVFGSRNQQNFIGYRLVIQKNP